MKSSSEETNLVPTMGLFALVMYGLGDMLGAGIYGLVGVAAGLMGNMLWVSFLISMLAALLTGLSYASLGSRHPRAGGAAYVVERAFKRPFLSYMVGLAVMASGFTSMAAAGRAFAQYAEVFAPALAPGFIIATFLLALALINFQGIKESSAFNILCTILELGGLFFIIVVGLRYWGTVDLFDATSVTNPTGELTTILLMQGAVLTFYSFIGFEDMINVSEEVKDAPRVFPKALVIALVLTSIVYILVSITAVSVVTHSELARAQGTISEATGPLAKVANVAAPWLNTSVFTVISLFAIANTALLNFIMGSRLAYGMAREGLLPRVLGRVHKTRRTPHIAILVLFGIVLVLSLIGDLSHLASATSLLMLTAFVIVNGSLIALKRRHSEPHGLFEVPMFVPVLGIIVCSAMIASRIFNGDSQAPLIAGGILVAIATLYLILRPKPTVAR